MWKGKGFTQRVLILLQYFLIIMAYHVLKDLKDTLVITSSDAGAKVIPFIKLWIILPAAFFISWILATLFRRVRREMILPIITTSLLATYALFAFCLYPNQQHMHLNALADHLQILLPAGCEGFTEMIRFWIFSLFYLTAELWSITILSVLFWGYLNDYTSMEEAGRFYPLCVLAGNCAAIVSGQTSHYFVHYLGEGKSWGVTLQSLIILVIACGVAIVAINHVLYRFKEQRSSSFVQADSEPFMKSLSTIWKSPTLRCIAMLVVGYALTSNLFEVVWKDSIKEVYPSPQRYNAYMNQLTSFIGLLAMFFSLLSKWLFGRFTWRTMALVTPIALLFTNCLFYGMKFVPHFEQATTLIMTLGTVCYVTALTAKYTIFDISKEMAFLQMSRAERLKGKAIIDSVGSRFGKSGASLVNSILLIGLASSGYFIVVGFISIILFVLMILSVIRSKGKQNQEGEV